MNAAQALLREVLRTIGALVPPDLRDAIHEELERADTTASTHSAPMHRTDPDEARRAALNAQIDAADGECCASGRCEVCSPGFRWGD